MHAGSAAVRSNRWAWEQDDGARGRPVPERAVVAGVLVGGTVWGGEAAIRAREMELSGTAAGWPLAPG